MAIYKKTYTDRKGKKRKANRWTAEFVLHGKPYRRAGFVDKDHARHWLLSEMNRMRRGETGYVRPMHAAPIMPQIENFIEYLRTAKGCDPEYVYIADTRLKRLAGEAGWKSLGHMTADSLEQWKARPSYWANRPEKPISARTKNQFIDIAQGFGAWLVKPGGMLAANPLAGVEKLRAKHNDAYRRAATEAEFDKLVSTCPSDRRLYYFCRLYQPVRSGTYGALTWRMAHLDATPPFFASPAAINKSRKDEKHVIRYELAQELRKLKKESRAKADDLMFPDPPTLADLKDDWARAGVAYDDGRGNGRLDFHSFRGTFVEMSKKAGLSALQIMELVGWKDMNTLMKYYNKRSVSHDVGAWMESLPTLGKVRMG
jgi:integrase